MKISTITCTGLLFLVLLSISNSALAHSALFNCFDNADGTLTCQGGFSDGSSATGVNIVIKDSSGRVLQEATLDSNSEVLLQKPQDDFTVLFNGGSGHSIEVNGRNITQ